MTIDYAAMSSSEFDSILMEILGEMKASELIRVCGFYELVSEEFNNKVLERWEKTARKKKEEEKSRGRKLTTGRCDTREELEECVLNDWYDTDRNMIQIARAYKVSSTTVINIMNSTKGKRWIETRQK